MNAIQNFYHQISGLKDDSTAANKQKVSSDVSFEEALRRVENKVTDVKPADKKDRPIGFHDVDRNKDGIVDNAEYESFLNAKGFDGEYRKYLETEFERFETEADGEKGVTYQEYDRWLKIVRQDKDSEFHYYDLNGDGEVTRDEIMSLAERNKYVDVGRLAEIGQKLDTNGDGKVSLAEYRAVYNPDADSQATGTKRSA